MRILFVCSYGRDRSATAAALYRSVEGIETDHGGTYEQAHTPLNDWQVAWADLIVVFTAHHQVQLRHRFGGLLDRKPVICLGIENRYPKGSAVLCRRIVRAMRHQVQGIAHPIVTGKDRA